MSHLTPAEMSRFRERLRARDLELRESIHESLVKTDDKSYAEVAGRVLDGAGLSVADMLSDLNIIRTEQEVAEQADVVAALARLTNGSYGRCVDCEDDIDVQRLDAYPTAKRCIRCQTHYETQRRGGKDVTPSL